MTIAKGAQPGQQVAVASSKLPDVSRPVILPAVLDELTATDGFRYPKWQSRALEPGERVATEQALVAIEGRCRPATGLQIMWHVGKLLSHWDSNQSAAVKDQLMEDWKHDLAGESDAHIFEACERWRRTQKFKPKIADILELIGGIKARDAETIRRARVLLELEPPRFWERPALPKPAPEQQGARSGMWATITKTLRSPSPPLQALPRRSAAEIRAELLQNSDPAAVEKLASLRKHA